MEITGFEKFTSGGQPLGYELVDFWRFLFSNIYDVQSKIAEFIVAKALGLEKACNTEYWTLWDIDYRGKRIEVKETSYYHPWNKDGQVSESRAFGITMANSRYADSATGTPTNGAENKFERQNDVYVFCLNTGNTAETSYPLEMDHWEFYVIPTSVINEKCKENKSISLNRVRSLTDAVSFSELKVRIDAEIDRLLAGRNDPSAT